MNKLDKLLHLTKYKVIALVVSVFIWFYVMAELGQDVFLYNKIRGIETISLKNVPIRILQKPNQSVRLVELEPASLDLEVTGQKKILSHLQAGDFIIYVDLTGFNAGEYSVLAKSILPSDVKMNTALPAVRVAISVRWQASDHQDSQLLTVDPISGEKRLKV